jgi:acetyltransferase-like isoleucine patch superfamily enzyme
MNTAWILRVAGYAVSRDVQFGGYSIAPNAYLGDKVTIGNGVSVGSNVRILAGCRVYEEAVLAHDVVLGEGTMVGNKSFLENVSVEQNSFIGSEVLCLGHGNGRIEIGSHCYIGPRCVLDWSDNLIIGDFVHVSGPSTAFWTHSSVAQVLHGDLLDNKQRRTTSPVVVEHHVYIGGNCTIYPGVRVGHHSIILPNSAVNKDVPAEHIVGGVPARVIRSVDPSFYEC